MKWALLFTILFCGIFNPINSYADFYKKNKSCILFKDPTYAISRSKTCNPTTPWDQLPDKIQRKLKKMQYTYNDSNQYIVDFKNHFNNKLTNDQRNNLLALFAKLDHEGLWSKIQTITWIGSSGSIYFRPKMSEVYFKSLLSRKGYGDWWRASKGIYWGVRSRFRGPQLHFKKYNMNSPSYEVHIDLNNPGDPKNGGKTNAIEELHTAYKHLIVDKNHRDKSHKPCALHVNLCIDNIPVYWVFE